MKLEGVCHLDVYYIMKHTRARRDRVLDVLGRTKSITETIRHIRTHDNHHNRDFYECYDGKCGRCCNCYKKLRCEIARIENDDTEDEY